MVLPHEQVKEDLQEYCSSVQCSDRSYVLPAFSYLIGDFLPWFKGHLIKKEMFFANERFDCDDFAQEFASCLKEAGLGLKENAGVAVGIMQVHNFPAKLSLGMAEGEHMLNLVGVKTLDGHSWLVVEPQNQNYVFLKDYKTAGNLRVAF
jgi:hypothetical protein